MQVYAEFGKSAEDCFPSLGYYFSAPGRAVPCPDGGFCAGNRTSPVTKPGFWGKVNDTGDGERQYSFFPCATEEACPGNLGPDECAEGYQGFICGECVVGGWYRSRSVCKRCPKLNLLILVAMILVFLILTAAVAKLFGGSVFLHAGMMAIFTQFLQSLYVISLIKTSRFPESLSATISAITAPFVLKLDLFALECVASDFGFYQKWALTLSLPAIFFSVFSAVFLFSYAYHRKDPIKAVAMRSRSIGAFLFIMILGYITVTSASFEVFGCWRSGDVMVLLNNPSIKCYDDEFNRRFLAGGVSGVAVFSLGMPLSLIVFLYKCKDKIRYRSFTSRFGSLFAIYHPVFPYWESVVMLEKSIMVIIVYLFIDQPRYGAS